MTKKTKKDSLKHTDGSIFSKGYGTIAKIPMQDRDLTVEAKAIYAYLCSYMGTGDVAFPSVNKICYDLQISKSRYYKHFKLLLENGYLEVNRVHYVATGQWANNEYTMVIDI